MNTELLTQNPDVVTQMALIAIFVTLIAMFIAILTLHQNQSKKLDALKDELISFKLEVKEEFTDVKLEIGGLKAEVSILSKLFGRFETDVKEVNMRVNKVEEVQTQQVTEAKTVKETVEKLSTVSENNSTRIKNYRNRK